ncbi:trichothecene 3-O-acetyltransferase, putative [Talaromyces stipitatus ATCC 10500]|uniref:Trichothecene 3-O-acetyltransferase, putative n=1 Tax=Talaromyces stipitatus (strain ATCC 10500 / CBS 375.48 / QM 6759 / NRRL 1006) TaxID=441959 RepID=B8LX32_TALSN|nr:trichothecene 3-O-acetyltransferase, putative [Talaromyces stipitatus ATCC 10500]EED22682.1 trichothecene 3-O-acetyltransferase, putative [Talaromyces stipitatus ATCC 10500]
MAFFLSWLSSLFVSAISRIALSARFYFPFITLFSSRRREASLSQKDVSLENGFFTAPAIVEKHQDWQDLDRYQDVLGQLPMLQVYAHILYLFPLPENVRRKAVLSDLSRAVASVRKAVPWMGAKVINEGRSETSSGLYKVTEDLAGDETCPSYEELKKRKAPISLLDARKFTSVPGFPIRFEDSEKDPSRVLRLNATFIKGGLVIDFLIHHNTADAGGHFGSIKMIAMAMRGEKFPARLLEQANLDRRNLFPLLGPHEPMMDHSSHVRTPITSAAPLVTSDPNSAKYHVIRFSAEKLNMLKDIASENLDRDVPFISTDDALSAHCWKHFTLARAHKFGPQTKSRFARAVDGRSALGISKDYMGDVIHNVSTFLTFEQLTTWPLSRIASHLRRHLNAKNTAYDIRSFATFIANTPDKSTITYGGQFNPDTDVGCSSVRGLGKVLFPSFGILGQPEFVRRPKPGVAFPGLLVFFPGSPSGDCDVWVCLAEDEIKTLTENDREWRKWAEYIG